MAQAAHCEYVDPDTGDECGLDAELAMIGWLDGGPGQPAVVGMGGELIGKHLCDTHRAQGETEGWVATKGT